jgi:aminoglycoside phosphotransferase (APT) family kinase protein
VQGWRDRWTAACSEASAEMDAVADWLVTHLPPDPARPAVVHGDYKLDNVMLSRADPSSVVAVLDWEMCALGDPLVDVGILLGYWSPPSEEHGAPDALTTVTDRPGYFDRAALLERYGRRTSADLTRIGFYETFAVFKLAVVLQQIFIRYVRGQTDDVRFAGLGARVQRLARQAAALAERHT